MIDTYVKRAVCVITFFTALVAVLISVAVLNEVMADVGKKEPGTFFEDKDLNPEVWVYKDGVYLRQMGRSRFDKKDPNYWWLFDQCPCCYPELWTGKWACPQNIPFVDTPPQSKNIPEPPALLLFGSGLVTLALLKSVRK